MTDLSPLKGSDCRSSFRKAYENRYTWEKNFPGYKGNCIWQNSSNRYEGQFIVGRDLKPNIYNINNQESNQAISQQLFEIAIHRVKRSFESVHSNNTFIAGDLNDIGLEVIVGGNSKGDKYRIKDNVVTMVKRHIHGKLVQIFTKEIVATSNGYLSTKYTSQYLNPLSGNEPESALCVFNDKYVPLGNNQIYLLETRTIEKKAFKACPSSKETFSFLNLILLDI